VIIFLARSEREAGHDVKIRSETRGQVQILEISGNVTAANEEEYRQAFRRPFDEGRLFFVFDLTQVPFMDSSAIGQTVGFLRRARDANGSIRLVLVRGGNVEEILRLTALDRIFEIYADLNDALDGLPT
jgi:anti-sigma B factor antagonist